jgi:hypothetical protein
VRELKLLGTSIKINHTTRYLPQHKLDAGIYNLILANEKFVDRINNITECLCAPVCVCVCVCVRVLGIEENMANSTQVSAC